MKQKIKVTKNQSIDIKVSSGDKIKITGDTHKSFFARKLDNDLIITYANGAKLSLLDFYKQQALEANNKKTLEETADKVNTVKFDNTTIVSTDVVGKLLNDNSILVKSYGEEALLA
ncbi:hypothetical protein CVPH_1469 [Abyssogena phaseoliformis symbiont OG214]|uniref:hypothetical protein n=1 Tax=Abyssogena phaseoliformis symbiont TaxID=596095 RepID=UPI001916B1C2|nr:hypothetical protein [Abyssogena phaseoliformis symbiont]BBB23308.1 hypothetical protein CVPH_1469 [Abyssogena phaseoliformis symbiont OG214]